MYKVYIDGQEGTTGLKIYERLENRKDIEILRISDEKRKDPAERKKFIEASDYTFLCLPDAASIEAVSLCENPDTIIIDASTAHRTNPSWDYGFPELSEKHRDAIKKSKRIANPGCYASGAISILYPMIESGILPKDYPVTINAVSGYSGAGKKAIAQYEAEGRSQDLDSPRLYALTQSHKHLPEMKIISGLEFEPVFNPYVCDYFQGMTVTIGFHTRLLKGLSVEENCSIGEQITAMFKKHYEFSKFVKVADFMGNDVLTEAFIPANTLAGTNNMQIIVYGNNERICVTSRFDNLGKGASGAAVQCMNISMGIDEATGL